MAEQSNSLNEQPSFGTSELDFSPAVVHQSIDHMPLMANVNAEAIEEILEEYSLQLVGLVEQSRELDSEELLAIDLNDLSELLFEIAQQRLENRDRIELLFVELSRKMWKGQLPATSIAIVERQYRDSTGRLLNDDLKDEQWSAYFSAFQLSIDILNSRTLQI